LYLKTIALLLKISRKHVYLREPALQKIVEEGQAETIQARIPIKGSKNQE